MWRTHEQAELAIVESSVGSPPAPPLGLGDIPPAEYEHQDWTVPGSDGDRVMWIRGLSLVGGSDGLLADGAAVLVRRGGRTGGGGRVVLMRRVCGERRGGRPQRVLEQPLLAFNRQAWLFELTTGILVGNVALNVTSNRPPRGVAVRMLCDEHPDYCSSRARKLDLDPTQAK